MKKYTERFEVSFRSFIMSAVSAVLIVASVHAVPAPAMEVQAAVDYIKSHGRIVYNNGVSNNRNDDVVLFDASDIRMLNNRLEQLETRVERLRNR